jgi:nicotinamidase/pyrazinamidase
LAKSIKNSSAALQPFAAHVNLKVMTQETKKALIVVDVQNDFCPGGSLGVAHGEEVIAPLNHLIREFLDRGEPVYKTRDWHPAQTKHFTAYGGVWPVHCVQNTSGAEFHPDLLDDPRIKVISKGIDETADGYSGFDGTNLGDLLREAGVEEIWVGGLATDYCVKETVIDGARNGFKVKALADAMRAVNLHPEDGAKAIEQMRAAGAEIVGSLEL